MEHPHDASCLCSHSSKELGLSEEVIEYLHIASKDPATLYAFLKSHKELISSSNIEQIRKLIAMTVQDAENPKPAPLDVLLSEISAEHSTDSSNSHNPTQQHGYNPQKVSDRASSIAKIQLAKFFFLKMTILKFCLDYGLDSFFEENLCSDPPDAIVMLFQKELILWNPQQALKDL